MKWPYECFQYITSTLLDIDENFKSVHFKEEFMFEDYVPVDDIISSSSYPSNVISFEDEKFIH